MASLGLEPCMLQIELQSGPLTLEGLGGLATQGINRPPLPGEQQQPMRLDPQGGDAVGKRLLPGTGQTVPRKIGHQLAQQPIGCRIVLTAENGRASAGFGNFQAHPPVALQDVRPRFRRAAPAIHKLITKTGAHAGFIRAVW